MGVIEVVTLTSSLMLLLLTIIEIPVADDQKVNVDGDGRVVVSPEQL